jgi:hypothetical protein
VRSVQSRSWAPYGRAEAATRIPNPRKKVRFLPAVPSKAPRERGRMARHTASTRDTSVRSRPLAQCRYGRSVRHHLARVNKWVRLPLPAPSSWVFWSVGLRARHDAQHRVHGGLQNRTGSDHPRRASRSHRRTARRLLSACGQVRFLMGALSSRRSIPRSSIGRTPGFDPGKRGPNPRRATIGDRAQGGPSASGAEDQAGSIPASPTTRGSLSGESICLTSRTSRVRFPGPARRHRSGTSWSLRERR